MDTEETPPVNTQGAQIDESKKGLRFWRTILGANVLVVFVQAIIFDKSRFNIAAMIGWYIGALVIPFLLTLVLWGAMILLNFSSGIKGGKQFPRTAFAVVYVLCLLASVTGRIINQQPMSYVMDRPATVEVPALPPASAQRTHQVMKRFSTNGHPKAKEARFSLEYPETWIAKEEAHPNIVQMFMSNRGESTPGGREVATILVTQPLPTGVLVDDVFTRKTLSNDGLIASAAAAKASITGVRQTTIKGKLVGLIEYTVDVDRPDLQAHTAVAAFVFFQGQTLIHVSVQVITSRSVPADRIEASGRAKDLRQAMMNSIVFEN